MQSSSSAKWTSEPPVSPIISTEEEEPIEEDSTIAEEESRKTGHTEGSKIETSKDLGRTKTETGVRDLSKETKIKEKETETLSPKHDQNSTTTVSATI